MQTGHGFSLYDVICCLDSFQLIFLYQEISHKKRKLSASFMRNIQVLATLGHIPAGNKKRELSRSPRLPGSLRSSPQSTRLPHHSQGPGTAHHPGSTAVRVGKHFYTAPSRGPFLNGRKHTSNAQRLHQRAPHRP